MLPSPPMVLWSDSGGTTSRRRAFRFGGSLGRSWQRLQLLLLQKVQGQLMLCRTVRPCRGHSMRRLLHLHLPLALLNVICRTPSVSAVLTLDSSSQCIVPLTWLTTSSTCSDLTRNVLPPTLRIAMGWDWVERAPSSQAPRVRWI